MSSTQFHPHGAVLATNNGNTNSSSSSSSSSTLRAVHYANVLAYLANVTVTYIIGISGLFGLPTNGELSVKYQTLVTPAGYAFSIWGLVFVSQFVWVVLQLVPKFRQSAIQGVGWWYVVICMAQCAWSVFFSQEWILMSMVAMGSILVSLVIILISQSRSAASPSTSTPTTAAFWGFQFPFQIHCGWIWAASLVNANVVVVAEGFSAGYQYFSAWVSLGGLGMVALFYTWRQSFIVPLVLAWASTGIYVELMQPQESILLAFDQGVLEYLKYAALGFAIAIVAFQGAMAMMRWRSSQGEASGASRPSIPAVELSGRNSIRSVKGTADTDTSGGGISTDYVRV